MKMHTSKIKSVVMSNCLKNLFCSITKINGKIFESFGLYWKTKKVLKDVIIESIWG